MSPTNDRDDKIYDPVPGKSFTPNKPIYPTNYEEPDEEEGYYRLFKKMWDKKLIGKFMKRYFEERSDVTASDK